MGRHIFTLMLIGAGNEEAVYIQAGHFGAKGGGAGGAEACVGAICISLKHRANVGARR